MVVLFIASDCVYTLNVSRSATVMKNFIMSMFLGVRVDSSLRDDITRTQKSIVYMVSQKK